MKRNVIAACLLIGLTIHVMAANDKVQAPANVQLAALLMQAYAGEDNALNEAETTGVLKFLQNNLPEKTGCTNLSVGLSRQNNVKNAPRGDMTEERDAIREQRPEHYVKRFIAKYDQNKDSVLNRWELSNAMINVIGLPSDSGKLSKKSIANR